MPGVYSHRFLQYRGAANQVTVQVPARKRAVIRGISWQAFSSPDTRVYLAIAGLVIWHHSTPVAIASGWEEVRFVAYAGEFITATLSGLDSATHVAGFLFDDPGGGAVIGQLPTEGGAVITPVPPGFPAL
jgi:hypothetical protein